MLSRKGKLIFGVIGSVLISMGVVAFALDVYVHIREGHAADTYDNFYGFHIAWSQAAAFLVSAPLILIGIWMLSRWQLWRRSRQEGVSPGTIRKELRRDL